MATFNSLKTKIQGLIDKSNAKTGNSDTDLTSAVDTLIAGFGQGGSSLPEYDGTVIIEREAIARKFKEVLTIPESVKSLSVGEAIEYPVEFYGSITMDITINVKGNAIRFYVSGSNDNKIVTIGYMITEADIEEITEVEHLPLYVEGTGFITTEPPIINITKWTDETAKAWLLANTEGVSV